LAHMGRLADAEPLLREACALSFRPVGALNPHPAFALAKVLRELGKPAEADAALESALRQANREGNEYVFQLLPPVYRALRAAHAADRTNALLEEQLASEAAWIERNGAVTAAAYSLAVLCAAAEVGAFEQIAPIVEARLAWWQQNHANDAPVHAYGLLSGEIMLAQGRQADAERALLVASEGMERTKRYWKSELLWRAGHLDGALSRFYAVCSRPEQPAHWRTLIGGGPFDPEWELSVARSLFDAGRYREAGEILPRARAKLEERLAAKPGNNRWAAMFSAAEALWKDCVGRRGESADVVIQPHVGK
jgi:tetratricopeptide (TPR) repeat protein